MGMEVPVSPENYPHFPRGAEPFHPFLQGVEDEEKVRPGSDIGNAIIQNTVEKSFLSLLFPNVICRRYATSRYTLKFGTSVVCCETPTRIPIFRGR